MSNSRSRLLSRMHLPPSLCLEFAAGLALALFIGLPISDAGAEVTYTAETSVSSGRALDQLLVGDIVTIDVTLRSDGELSFAVGGAATNWNNRVLEFQSGSAVPHVLSEDCPTPSDCFGGLTNFSGPALSMNFGAPLGNEVQFVNSINVLGSTHSGALDFGVNGVQGGAQFRLVFEAKDLGSTSMLIGADQDYGDAVIVTGGFIGISNNATLDFTVVPEPGTVVLLSLGLVVLSLRERRHESR